MTTPRFKLQKSSAHVIHTQQNLRQGEKPDPIRAVPDSVQSAQFRYAECSSIRVVFGPIDRDWVFITDSRNMDQLEIDYMYGQGMDKVKYCELHEQSTRLGIVAGSSTSFAGFLITYVV